MTLHRTTVTKRLFALLASTSLIMTMGACSSANETQSHETDSPQHRPLPPMPATW